MKRLFGKALISVTLSAGTATLQAGAASVIETGTSICIQSQDQTHVEHSRLESAQAEVTRIFRAAGADIIWREGVADTLEVQVIDMSTRDTSSHPGTDRTFGASQSGSCLVVSIVQNMPPGTLPGALGFSLPFARKGSAVVLYRDRIDAAARSANVPVYTALGYAMAHELGHVLLRSQEHSTAGIMQARWNGAVWKLASEGLLGFLPGQARQLRERIAAVPTLAVMSRAPGAVR